MTSELLADGAALGDRFVALVGEPGGPGWSTAGELFGTGLPVALAATGTRRGTGSPAVAGLLLFEQYAQRLVAPVIAALHRHAAHVDARPSTVWVELVDGTPHRLAFAHPARPGGNTADVARGLVATLDDAAGRLSHHTRVGRRLLRGAMANAVAMTYLHMSWPDVDRARYLDAARAFLDGVPGLAGLVNLDAVESLGEPWMYADRNTCCLAFRTSVNQAREQRYCSACPILPRDTTLALFAQATATYADRHPRGESGVN